MFTHAQKKTAHEERKRETAVRRDRASVGEWRSTRVVVARFPVSPHPPTPRRMLCMGRVPPANLKQYPLFLCSGTDKIKAAPPVRSVMRSRQNQGSTPRSFCVPVPLHWCCSPPRACTCQAAAQQRNNGGQVGVVWFAARMSTRTPPTRVGPTCTQDGVDARSGLVAGSGRSPSRRPGERPGPWPQARVRRPALPGLRPLQPEAGLYPGCRVAELKPKPKKTGHVVGLIPLHFA